MARKYSKTTGKIVAKTMDEYKHGKLKSGRAKQPVRSRAQAVAIGLSKARQAGEKVPKDK